MIPAETRFWDRVDTTGPCWEWTAGRNGVGYGVIAVTKRNPKLAHVFSWSLRMGWPDEDQIVGHVCDNPSCVRNDDEGVYIVRGIALPRWGHLWLGTQADNVADMVSKGRHWRQRLRA